MKMARACHSVET